MSIQDSITAKLQTEYSPSHLEVINESYMHNVPEGSESHFKVIITADVFEGKRSVARHQMIYGLLRAELDGPVHALAIHTYTAEEWAKQSEAPTSPDCMG
ncbi:MAG: BolA/IbaG family iron-sulfur metabolism protein [Pseudomonadales bacterium]|nr:BolA/IbaG family iron-sulfur metabolism protein [Pseudomonadales bacterium]